jgi:hypothetical protein
VRDYFRLDRGIMLMEVPRDDGWWLRGDSLYSENLARAGFKEVDARYPEPGDAFVLHLPQTGFFGGWRPKVCAGLPRRSTPASIWATARSFTNCRSRATSR